MTEWSGRFSEPDIDATEKHQTASEKEKKTRFPLPAQVTYNVPRDLVDRILARLGKRSIASSGKDGPPPLLTVPRAGAAMLATRTVTSVTYMDVGFWGGSAPRDENTADHWKKERHFGVIFERLSLLCAYEPWETTGKPPEPITNDTKCVPSKLDLGGTKQFTTILPFLTTLSADTHLGPVVVRQAVLNNEPGLAFPPDDRIHVFLGDLHAPVMREEEQTYAGASHPKHGARTSNSDHATSKGGASVEGGHPWATIGPPRVPHADSAWATGIETGLEALSPPGSKLVSLPGISDDKRLSLDTGLPSNPVPKLVNPAADSGDRRLSLETGLTQQGRYPLRGRYDRGVLAPLLVPALARVLGKGAKVVAKADTVLVTYAASTVAPAAAGLAAGVAVPALAALGEVANTSLLARWSDEDSTEISGVEDWFDRYRGTKNRLGADVFDGAGEDLERWLKMIKEYQGHADVRAKGAKRPPVKLIQTGDLFDFWIGLQRLFDLRKGAREFPHPDSAKKFVAYWKEETLRNSALEYLWNFDKEVPCTKDPELNTVFLYGNHDTYMGSPLVDNPLPARIDKEELGLIVQHGHQDDPFNNESGAGLGYLLTQAAFLDNYVREVEDPISAVKTKLFGGLWTRLGYNEAALKACIADRLNGKGPLASTFVMGHTHQPALQRIDIVIDDRDPSSNPDYRATTSTDFNEPLGTGSGPKLVSPVGTGLDARTSTAIGAMPLPPGLVCHPAKAAKVKITVSFVEVEILKGKAGVRWNLTAFIRPAAKQAQEVSTHLLEEASLNIGDPCSLPGKTIEAYVDPDDHAEILVHGWQVPDDAKGAHPESDEVSVRVHPNTWKRHSSLACKHFHVIFDIDWKC